MTTGQSAFQNLALEPCATDVPGHREQFAILQFCFFLNVCTDAQRFCAVLQRREHLQLQPIFQLCLPFFRCSQHCESQIYLRNGSFVGGIHERK